MVVIILMVEFFLLLTWLASIKIDDGLPDADKVFAIKGIDSTDSYLTGCVNVYPTSSSAVTYSLTDDSEHCKLVYWQA
jgi:hypothetical protein